MEYDDDRFNANSWPMLMMIPIISYFGEEYKF
jgi:hypothetical protein